MNILTRIRRLGRRKLGDFHAWRRGDRRIAPPHAVRGRLYEKKDNPGKKAGSHSAAPRATVSVTGRVIRKDGTIEDIPNIRATASEGPPQ